MQEDDGRAWMQRDGASHLVLSVRDVHKRFGRRRVLAGVTFEAFAGQTVAIVGENGSGKSTLLRILAGASRMDHGRVEHAGALGYCPQEALLYPYLTVDEHLDLFGRAYGLSRAQRSARADLLVEELALVPHRGRIVQELSGGTRQKLNLSIALLHDPPLLLLDEPYAGFDVETYHRFLDHTQRARAAGKCIVLVTHLVLEPQRFDVLLHLRGGRIDAARA